MMRIVFGCGGFVKREMVGHLELGFVKVATRNCHTQARPHRQTLMSVWCCPGMFNLPTCTLKTRPVVVAERRSTGQLALAS